MSYINTITKEYRYLLKIPFIKSIKVVGALVNSKNIQKDHNARVHPERLSLYMS